MAEDGSEEIMFICKWPLPVASAHGVALAAHATPCPHFVFVIQKSCSFLNDDGFTCF